MAGGKLAAHGNVNARTFGGFDQMTAIVGGLWDALLGEGRRFWIVATSDSHANFGDANRPGTTSGPGSSTRLTSMRGAPLTTILDGLRAGRMFVVAGDLITELDILASGPDASAAVGGTLRVKPADDVRLSVTFRDPAGSNARGDYPSVDRIDLIVGRFTGPATNRNGDHNETARVFARFVPEDWSSEGDVHTISTIVPPFEKGGYIRVRGTHTDDAEPPMDTPGENPWSDLWFHSNPIFVEVR